jgi:hypothetical protein
VTVRAAVGNARRLPVTMLAATVAVCGTSGCSDANGRATGHSTSSTTSTQRAAGLGIFVVRHATGGLVVVDRATNGRRLRLTGIQAGECLGYLRANPRASAASVRAACPLEHEPAANDR